MLRGNPLNFHKQRRNRNWNVGHHKQRESKEISKETPPLRTVEMFTF